MILPIIAYGDPVLRKVGKEIPQDYPNLEALVDDMFEKHNELERQIKLYSNEKVKDSIVYLDPILEFEYE